MDTTPVKRPDRLEPGKPEGTAPVVKFWPGSGDCGAEELVEGRMTVPVGGGLAVLLVPVDDVRGGPEGWIGWRRGVAGALGEGEGEADSTTHMRWERVATSLATVCPRVE